VRDALDEQLVRVPTGDGMAPVFRLRTPQWVAKQLRAKVIDRIQSGCGAVRT
jgi:hypothetical protein